MITLLDLGERFVSAADSLMVKGGWDRDPWGEGRVGVGSTTLGMFTRQCGADFRGYVSFELDEIYRGTRRSEQTVQQPFFRVSVQLGLSYGAADRVQRMLRATTTSFAAIDMRIVAGAEAETGIVNSLDDAEAAACRLVNAIDRRALATLNQYSEVTAFIGLVRWASPPWERFVVPAVLGASGRTIEAEQWLTEAALRRRVKGEPHGYSDYARRLRAWLSSGARVPEEKELQPEVKPGPLPPLEVERYMPRDIGDR